MKTFAMVIALTLFTGCGKDYPPGLSPAKICGNLVRIYPTEDLGRCERMFEGLNARYYEGGDATQRADYAARARCVVTATTSSDIELCNSR